MSKKTLDGAKGSTPHDAALANETVSAQRYNDGMTWSCSSEVSSDDCTTRDDGLSSQDDVLWPSDGGSARDLVTCILCLCLVSSTANGWSSLFR